MSYTIKRHADAAAFLARAEGWLMQREAEHNLLIGLAHRLRKSTTGYEQPIYLATVEDNGAVVGCAFRTPPYKLGLTRMPMDAMPHLIEDLADMYRTLPAVLGPEPATSDFASQWTERLGIDMYEGARQRIYQLERVSAPARLPAGGCRLAGPGDAALMVIWLTDFISEAGVEPVDVARLVAERMAERSLYIWEDGEPRAMAGVAGVTPNGARVGYVYTPPDWRNRGYASACTAEVSRTILESGKRFCCLYTDLDNPTTNDIYQQIGYERVCDVSDWKFTEA